MSPFSARRHRLLQTLGGGIAVLPTAPEAVRNRDIHHPYRFDSYFWYLTGFAEPEAVLVLVGGKRPRSLLFCREKNEKKEIWEGRRHGPEAAKALLGFDAAYPIAEFDRRFPKLLAGRSGLWHTFGIDPLWDARVTRAMHTLRAQARSGIQPPQTIHDLRAALDTMRLEKDATEIETMNRAAQIAAAGHLRAMRACRPGMREYALEAELSYEFRRRGAAAHAYAPIVAGGENACILHYTANDQELAEGALVLIDAGCELDGYAADITRTFPVNGRFSLPQREVYEIVLAAQAAAVAAIAPGRNLMEAHEAAVRILTRGLVDMKLLCGDLDNLIETKAYAPFYMHSTSHWLGLDVHDAGAYKVDGAWTALRPGMTLTVEPGLYLRPGKDVPPALAGIGVRIEDDVRVTENAGEIYTALPRSVADIEETMRRD